MTLEIYAQTRVPVPGPRLITSFAFPCKNLSSNGTGIKNNARTPLAETETMFRVVSAIFIVRYLLAIFSRIHFPLSVFSFQPARRLIFIRLWLANEKN